MMRGETLKNGVFCDSEMNAIDAIVHFQGFLSSNEIRNRNILPGYY
jgi:hypothetical protein